MAFNTNTAAATQTSNDSWKAAGFLNFYLPGPDGKPSKLGAIGIKAGHGTDDLLEYLGKDPANAAKLLSVITVNYQSATPSSKNKFVLPV